MALTALFEKLNATTMIRGAELAEDPTL